MLIVKLVDTSFEKWATSFSDFVHVSLFLFFLLGGDDRRVLLWNMEKALSDIGSPFIMKGEHNSNIFCLAFDNENRKVFSGGK